jgi:hypothetical protein
MSEQITGILTSIEKAARVLRRDRPHYQSTPSTSTSGGCRRPASSPTALTAPRCP